ncbi:MAG: hypothetical protein CMP23_13240 [Rickettsiales bacterium]|nr:hypothetical protein [Rickettsiales bacterium]|tara:strand:- start:446 stop:2380 length:1935 start_codon:yes stop_codon:yes gene_type:complete
MNMRILLVEDDHYFSGILGDYLGHLGLEVLRVADGVEALQLATESPVDLVLSDVFMPRLNGFELVARLREQEAYRKLPLLLMSAVYQDEQVVQRNLLQSGADDYLIKPFTMAQLSRKLGEYLDLKPELEGALAVGGAAVIRESSWERSVELPERGEIDSGFVAEFMLQLLAASHTGVLKMVDGSRWKDIVFLNGYPMWSDGGGTHNRMGTMLLEEGTIEPVEFRGAVQHMRDHKVDFGSALIQTGLLSPTELYSQLRRLTERRVVSALSWAVGTWTLTTGLPRQASCFEVNPLVVVWKGLGLQDQARNLVNFIAPYEQMYVIPTETYQSFWQLLGGVEAFEALGSFVNGRRRVCELREFEVLTDGQLAKALWLMFKAGMVGFSEQPAGSGQLSSSPEGQREASTAQVPTIDPKLQELADCILRDYLRLWQADFFVVFGLQPEADEQAFAQALAGSPLSWNLDDVSEDLPAEIRARARALLGWVEEARDTLSHPASRKAYGLRLEEGATGAYVAVSAPDCTEAAFFFDEGKRQVRLHDYLAAERSFAHAVEADPSTPEYKAYRAWAGYRGAGGSSAAVQSAVSLLRSVLQADSHQPMAHYFLGLIQRDQREFPAAVASLRKALSIDPGFDSARKALGQVEELAGL